MMISRYLSTLVLLGGMVVALSQVERLHAVKPTRTPINLRADVVIFDGDHRIIASGNVHFSLGSLRANSQFLSIDSERDIALASGNVITSIHVGTVSSHVLAVDMNANTWLASGQVITSINATRIHSQTLLIEPQHSTLLASGNVNLHTKKQVTKARTLLYNWANQTIVLNKAAHQLTVQLDSTEVLYTMADSLHMMKNAWSGTNGLITTCDFPTPHYYVKARRFDYYPGDKIIGYNVTIDAPIGLIPLRWWAPWYVYYLDQRNAVWTAPQVGHNRVEGFFAKNRVDYYFSKVRNGQMYLDYVDNLEGFSRLGAGVRNHYRGYKDRVAGMVYIYQIAPFYVRQVQNTLALRPGLSLFHNHKNTNMYRLLGSQRIRSTQNTFKIAHNYLNNKNNIGIDHLYDAILGQDRFNITYQHRPGNNQSSLDAHWRVTSLPNTKTTFAELNPVWHISDAHQLATKLNVDRYQSSSNIYPDETLRTQLRYTYRAPHWGTMQLSYQFLVDLDDTLNTEDNQSTYVENLPKITIQPHLTTVKGIRLQQHYTLGKTRETRYLSNIDTQRTFEADHINMQWDIDHTLSDITGGDISMRYAYYQNYYSSGELNFELTQTYQYQADWLNHVLWTTNYHNSGSRGNSPFFFDDPSRSVNNRITQSIQWYLVSPSKYAYHHALGWNWATNRPIDYQTSLLIHPKKTFRLHVQSGIRFAQNLVNTSLRPIMDIVGDMIYQPHDTTHIRTIMSWDPNYGLIRRFSQSVRFQLGSSWENRWTYDIAWALRASTQELILSRIELIKDLHKRTLTLTYQEALQEFRVTYTINAFPQSSVGFSTSETESFKWEGGLLNNDSVDRL